MAYILLPPDLTNKGVLILKHLELDFWLAMPEPLRFTVRQKYLVGLYFGFAMELNGQLDDVDFFVAADNVIIGFHDEKPTLPLNGFHFIDSSFDSDLRGSIEYDFVFIGNSQRRKNLLELVRSVGSMAESPSFCIINRVGKAIESKLYAIKVRRALRRLSYEARKRIRYIEIPPDGDGIPSFLVSKLLRSCRALVCISRVEGAARVVAEAVLNNLPIIYYSKMVGGTCNHLDNAIDFRVDEIEALPSVLDEAYRALLDRGFCERGDGGVYLEVNSKRLLVAFLLENFSEHISESAVQAVLSKSLYNAFSGHQNHLPESLSTRETDEVLSYHKMYSFLGFLLGRERPVPIKLKLRDVKSLFISPWRSFKGLIKAVVS